MRSIYDTLVNTGKVAITYLHITKDQDPDYDLTARLRVKNKLNLLVVTFEDGIDLTTMLDLAVCVKKFAAYHRFVLFRNIEFCEDGVRFHDNSVQISQWYEKFIGIEHIYPAPHEIYYAEAQYIDLDIMYYNIFSDSEGRRITDYLDGFIMPHPLSLNMTEHLAKNIMSIYAQTLHGHSKLFQKAIDRNHFIKLACNYASSKFTKVATSMTLDSYLLGETPEEQWEENEKHA